MGVTYWMLTYGTKLADSQDQSRWMVALKTDDRRPGFRSRKLESMYVNGHETKFRHRRTGGRVKRM